MNCQRLSHTDTLSIASSTRHLDVMRQRDTSFNHHIDSIVTKANQTLAFPRRTLTNGLNTDQGPCLQSAGQTATESEIR